jgi:hypothetical protein
VRVDPDRHLHTGLLPSADLRWWLAEDKQASGVAPAFYQVTSAGPVPAGGTARSEVSGHGHDMRFGVTSGRSRTLSPTAGTHPGDFIRLQVCRIEALTRSFETGLPYLGVKRSAVRIRPARQKPCSEALFLGSRPLDTR